MLISLHIYDVRGNSDLFLGLAWPASWLVSFQRQKWQESPECWLACWCLLSFILCKYSHNYQGEIREKNVTKMSGEAESSPGRNIPTPEQCFYASFKIYLSDSRTNSICELEDSGENTFVLLVGYIETPLGLSQYVSSPFWVTAVCVNTFIAVQCI